MPEVPSRRELFAAAAAVGVGPAAFHRAVAAQAETPAGPVAVTADMVKAAEWVAGITLTDAERTKVAAALTGTVRSYAAARKVVIANGVPPAVRFDPAVVLRGKIPTMNDRMKGADPAPLKVDRPAAADDLAFLPVTALAALVKAKKVSSVELTKLYLDRLHKFDPVLKCVVTFTDDLAIKQAKAADEEIAAGTYRGPLHGIPWGAKDLISLPEYRTTWGAGHFHQQSLPETATVAKKLADAGAVLVAKLTLGALAWGDQWFGGMTRNPWNVKEGSSGSSAGSSCAASAGLVGFAVGSETLGSIVSPSTRCGATGLRPTFGRVSRHGCMALAWTMDKIGPLARSAADCGLVLDAIRGRDPLDPTAVDEPFESPYSGKLSELKVGVFESTSAAVRKTLVEMGVQFVPIKLPSGLPVSSLSCILTAECAAAFDDLTRAGVVDGIGNWPTTFREGQFVTAVEYLRAQRIRTLLMREMAAVMEKVDVYVGGGDLLLTNMTGHPSVCLPDGFTKRGGVEVPKAITFTGQLYGESALLAVAGAYQAATGHHLKRPPQETWVEAK